MALVNKNNTLVVDLDGTLIKTDLLLESVLLLLKQNPFYLLVLPFWILKGAAYTKLAIAERVTLEVDSLPFNQQVVDYIVKQRNQGVAVYLVSGSVAPWVQAVGAYLGCFDGCFGTKASGKNLTGVNKVNFIEKELGLHHYDYLGNSAQDLPVWQHSATALVVSSSQALLKKVKKNNTNYQIIDQPSQKGSSIIKAMRPHQWVKNSLICVPLLTSHQFLDFMLLLDVLFGFIAFSLVASAVYVLNDLLDLAADRKHPTKKNRPFASGALSILTGFWLLPCLLVVAFLISIELPSLFQLALIGYFVLTCLYSFKLKQMVLIDTVMLALLYTSRIIAGTVLINVAFSYWLLAFSMFIFFSLALVKRHTELIKLKQQAHSNIAGRGYELLDESIISQLGVTSGLMAVLVLALYITNPAIIELYQHQGVLWLACLILLYWVSRVWLLSHRGLVDDDPILFAVKDRQSLFSGVLIFGVFVIAA